MAVVRLFAAARIAAGTPRDTVPGATVAEVLRNAVDRYGPEFAAVAPQCALWRNGDPATLDDPVADDDEIGILPPVSGGAA